MTANMRRADELIKSVNDALSFDDVYGVHVNFHKLWSADVGGDGYDKDIWRLLDAQLQQKLLTLFGAGWLTRASVNVKVHNERPVLDAVAQRIDALHFMPMSIAEATAEAQRRWGRDAYARFDEISSLGCHVYSNKTEAGCRGIGSSFEKAFEDADVKAASYDPQKMENHNGGCALPTLPGTPAIDQCDCGVTRFWLLNVARRCPACNSIDYAHERTDCSVPPPERSSREERMALMVAEALKAEPIMQFLVIDPTRSGIIDYKFEQLACAIIELTPPNSERAEALRKLVEAKDAWLRAIVMKYGLPPESRRIP